MKNVFILLNILLLCIVSLTESRRSEEEFSREECGGVRPCKKRHERRSYEASEELKSWEYSEEKKEERKPEPVIIKPTPLPEHHLKFSCDGLRDGFYSHGCSRFYVKCVSQKVTIKQCPHHLRYDVITRTCITAVQVRACKRDSREEHRGRCSMAPRGFVYTRECSSNFVACIAREPVPMKCPHNHVFDTVTYKCVSRCTVVRCGHVPSCRKPHKPHFKCTHRPDGYYHLGCSSKYVSCQNGIATIMHCAVPSLRYDVTVGQCLGAYYVKACGGHPTPLPATVKPPFVCHRRKNGPYALGCSQQFVMCESGVAEFGRCREGLRFDEHTRHCHPKPPVCARRHHNVGEAF